VFLIGDAAHVHTAIGGPGLNLGMQDVLNLGWKLAAEINGWAPQGLLDTYESERRPVGERVIMHTRAQMALVSPGAGITALRSLFGELLADPGATRRIAELIAGADIRYGEAHTHPMTGRWMPDLPLSTGAAARRPPAAPHPHQRRREGLGRPDPGGHDAGQSGRGGTHPPRRLRGLGG
jgi:hypothetical protein